MSARIRLLFEFRNEVAEARDWYEEQRTGLGDELLEEIYAAIARAEGNPGLFKKTYADCHRIILRRFPYALYYRLKGDTALFVLLFHFSRDPRLIRRRLRKRREDI